MVHRQQLLPNASQKLFSRLIDYTILSTFYKITQILLRLTKIARIWFEVYAKWEGFEIIKEKYYLIKLKYHEKVPFSGNIFPEISPNIDPNMMA